MAGILYGLGFACILIASNIVKYRQEEIIDRLFSLDSNLEEDRFVPNITFEGFIFLDQLLVCFLAYAILSIGKAYHLSTSDANEPIDPISIVQISTEYERVQTIQHQKQRSSLDSNNKQTINRRPILQQTQCFSSAPLRQAKIPIQYSIALGILYFISIKAFAPVQTKFNISMAVGFKALNLLIYFIVNFSIQKVELRLPFIGIRLTFGRGKMSDFFSLLLAFLIAGSSMLYFAIDDLFRIAMVDSNRSLNLIFDAKAVAFYGFSLLVEYAIFGILMTIQTRYQGVSSVQFIATFLQFSALCFCLNLLCNGMIFSTLEFLYKYQGSLKVLAQLCITSFFQYLAFAYTLINYPLVALAILYWTKPCIKHLSKHLIEEESVLGVFYGVFAVGIMAFVVQLAMFDQRNQKKCQRNNFSIVEPQSSRIIVQESMD